MSKISKIIVIGAGYAGLVAVEKLAKNPNNGHTSTSDLATNLRGKVDPSIGMSR